MKNIFSINWILVAAVWYTLNGILHDIFIIKAHKGAYNRDLLRLLMDGHVLIFSGIISAICWHAIRSGNIHGAVIGFVVALGMIIYCAMIFPFLKSFVTLVISFILAAVCVWAFIHLKNNNPTL